MKKISHALISVHDKRDVVEFATFLSKKGVTILSSGGTAKILERNKVKIVDVSRLTGFPELLGGQITTLHPLIFGSILGSRTDTAHIESLKTIGADPIDLVVVNFPPFQTMDIDEKANKKWEEALAQISVSDISIMRAAAKNFPDVVILTSPDQYKLAMEEMEKTDGRILLETRKKFALKAFESAISYDIEVHKYLAKQFNQEEQFHDIALLKYEKTYDLRYGENPHQKAAFYQEPGFEGASLSNAVQLWGKTLSYNNVVDMDAALRIVMEFDKTAAVVVKHANPIGVAVDRDATRAYLKARDVDPVSAFGSVVAFNDTVEKKTAKELTTTFIEAVVAPRFTDGALEEIKKGIRGKHMRVIQLTTGKRVKPTKEMDVRKVSGGLLIQESDHLLLPRGGHLKVLTKRKPTRKQLADMILAWKVCKYVRSNAIVLARDMQTIGTGTGQMSRIDSMKIAVEKAGAKTLGSVMASDAFIPFRDVIDEAARCGILAIIQPGGSMRDDEIIMAADEHNISMAITGMRHFKL